MARDACLAAASAVMPSHKPCVVAVLRGVSPISQSWKLRPTRAQSSPAAPITEGAGLLEAVAVVGESHRGLPS